MAYHEDVAQTGFPCDECGHPAHFTGYGENNTPFGNHVIYAKYRCTNCPAQWGLPSNWSDHPRNGMFDLRSGTPVPIGWFDTRTMTWNGTQWTRRTTVSPR